MFPHKMLRQLAPNWDSYGAKAIDPRCIDRAAVLWGQLCGDWQVVPCSDGGVQLEQHRDGLDIEITVSPAAVAELETVDRTNCTHPDEIYSKDGTSAKCAHCGIEL
jgi:hypothetical protein